MTKTSLQATFSKEISSQHVTWGTVYTSAPTCTQPQPFPAVIAIGAFDGLHKGHCALVRDAIADAREHGLACVVVTFDPDPADVLGNPQEGNSLLCIHDRCAGLLELGAQYVYALTFTKEFAAKSPREFLDYLVNELVQPVSIHVGTNFRFGYKGTGNLHALVSYGSKYGFEVRAHSLIMDDGQRISATRIRALLRDGAVSEANALLGRQHYVCGVVAHGRGEGHVFGFPTANVVCDKSSCMPREGVYAGYVIHGTHAWPAAINVGAPPTFSSPQPAFLEANLMGFEGDLYDQEVAVSFVTWLRASRPFDSLDELERVVMGNIDWVRNNLGDKMLEVKP